MVHGRFIHDNVPKRIFVPSRSSKTSKRLIHDICLGKQKEERMRKSMFKDIKTVISTLKSIENRSTRRTIGSKSWVALLVEGYPSNTASFVLCAFRRVKDHSLLHCSPLWKRPCVRQVVLDKWRPLTYDCVCVCYLCYVFVV